MQENKRKHFKHAQKKKERTAIMKNWNTKSKEILKASLQTLKINPMQDNINE
jgi:hypothetical protein